MSTAPPAQDEEVSISAEIPRGATIETAYVERQVRAYAVLENEAESLSAMGGQATTFIAVATFSYSIAIGIWVTAAFAEKVTPEGTVLAHFGAPILLGLGVVFTVLTVMVRRSSGSTWDRIRKESKSSSRKTGEA
jgi:hypothetical protein